MSDVEENNFEGRVSTKPREPSSAAARCSGFHRGERGGAGLRGAVRGSAGSSLWSHRRCSLIPRWLLGSTPAPNTTGNPSPPFLETDTWTPGSDFPCSAPSLLATPEASLSLWRGVGPRRGEAGGGGREFPSGRIVVGASCGGLSSDLEQRGGSRGRKCAGLTSGRGEAGVGLAAACVSLALCCSERPRLCWNRRRCAYKGESLEVEGGTSPMKWVVNDRSDP